MAKLLMDYTAFNESYMNGQFRFFQGGTGSPKNVQVPKDAVTTVINGNVVDSEVYSYMGDDGMPRALVCNVTTITATGTSTGLYFVCKADLSGADVAWTLVSGGTVGIRLEYDDKPVAGNPSGIVQVGDWLYITDYDSVNVYSVAIAALEDPSVADGGVVPVASYLIDDAYLPPLTVERHGVSLIALTDNSGTTPPDDGEEEDNSGTGDDETEDAAASAVTKLFALYNGAFEDGTHLPNSYVSAKVVRLGFDSNGNLVAEASVEVGMNTQSLTPVYDEERAVNLLVPAIGGIQQNGNTNGSNSTLHLVSGIFGTMAASIVFTGDGAPPTEETSGPAVSTSINYDIKSIGASDSAIVWLLLVTNDKNYLSWWRLFKTTVTDILGSNGKTLSEAIADGTLTPMDSGFGSPGYYWELLCESSVTDPGRLWFVMGTPVRISAMDNYNDRVLFDEGTLYKAVSGVFPDSVNIDSADLIGEMIYQYKLGNSIDTRLLKGQRPAAEDDDD